MKTVELDRGNYSSIPRRVRKRILANIEAVVDRFGNDADHQEEMIDHLIDISYDSYHIGWQAGFIDDTQEDPELKDFNPGGTSDD